MNRRPLLWLAVAAILGTLALNATADRRLTRLLVTALEECLRRAVERDRLAVDLAENDAELHRLREQVKRLLNRVEELGALAATAPEEAVGDAPVGWRLVYHREFRSATITRPDGVSITLDVYPPFWPEDRT